MNKFLMENIFLPCFRLTLTGFISVNFKLFKKETV